MLELTQYEILKIKKMSTFQKRMILGRRLVSLFLLFVMLYGVIYLKQQYLVTAVISCLILSFLYDEIRLATHDYFNDLLDIINKHRYP